MSGRITKDAALALKVRVALFEGTWEYYHGKKIRPLQYPARMGLIL
ncbi:hypothetical protein [Niabella hibiscisoli]|nr:hypothetical protein [Niabella hibiscisoli]MCH5719380.1 hypothetical protein [Niabella hibiscisoli]